MSSFTQIARFQSFKNSSWTNVSLSTDISENYILSIDLRDFTFRFDNPNGMSFVVPSIIMSITHELEFQHLWNLVAVSNTPFQVWARGLRRSFDVPPSEYVLVVDNDMFMAQMRKDNMVAGEAQLLQCLASCSHHARSEKPQEDGPTYEEEKTKRRLNQHQMGAMRWMATMESKVRNGHQLSYSGRLPLGKTGYAYHYATRTIARNETEKEDNFAMPCGGAVLTGSRGCGKTAVVLHYSIATSFASLTATTPDRPRAKTLVIVPVYLLEIWSMEWAKTVADLPPDISVKALFLCDAKNFNSTTVKDVEQSAVVVATTTYVDKYRNYDAELLYPDQFHSAAQRTVSRRVVSKQMFDDKTMVAPLHLFDWDRIVVDEVLTVKMHIWRHSWTTSMWWAIQADVTGMRYPAVREIMKHVGIPTLRDAEHGSFSNQEWRTCSIYDKFLRECVHEMDDERYARTLMVSIAEAPLSPPQMRTYNAMIEDTDEDKCAMTFCTPRPCISQGPCSLQDAKAILTAQHPASSFFAKVCDDILRNNVGTCDVCLDASKTTLAACGHMYCRACVESLGGVVDGAPQCPTCRRAMTPKPCVIDKLGTTLSASSACKRRESLRALLADGAPTIVIARWTCVMRSLTVHLNDHGISSRLLSGNARACAAALRSFCSGKTQVLLVTTSTLLGVCLPDVTKRVVFYHVSEEYTMTTTPFCALFTDMIHTVFLANVSPSYVDAASPISMVTMYAPMTHESNVLARASARG